MRDRLAQVLKSRFFRDTATLQVASAVNQASQFASTVVLAYLLGARGQGAFVVAIALQGLLHFLVNTGVVPATISQIAAAHVRGNHEKTAGWIAFVAKAGLLFCLAILAVGWFALPWFGEFFYSSREVGVWALILCLEPLFDLPRTVAAVAFQGTRRMRAVAQVENADEVVRFFLVVLGAVITGSPLGAVLGTVAAAVFGSILAIERYAVARRDGGPPLPGLAEIVRRMREVPLVRGLRLGLRVGLLKNGTALFLNIFPRLIIAKVVGKEWVSYFHIAQRILQIPTLALPAVARTALPALAELAGRKDWAGLRRLFSRVTLLTGSAITLVIGAAVALIPPVVGAVFPPDYAEPVFHFACILALGLVPYAFAAAIDSVYIATNQVKAWIWLTVLGAVITIPLNFVLVKAVPYTGTAWGLALYQSWVLVHVGYIYWYMYRSGGAGFGRPSPADLEDARVLEETSVDVAGRQGGSRE
ncbi:MAG: lipopolysaccharide biosynthesis protein [Planctomycetes bacterium]|nr:lipopolysaccharide biosynthesis protein [Planctomycetota bacterium]